MKTKAIILKIVASLVLVALVNSFVLAQRYSNDDYTNYIAYNTSTASNTVSSEYIPDIKDWMIDELVFTHSAENANIENWMVTYNEKMDVWSAEESYNTDWLLDPESDFELADWMIADQPNVADAYTHAFEVVDMMDWMYTGDSFGNVAEEEAIVLEQWMVNAEELVLSNDTDVVLENWMLDQKYWGK